MTEPAPPPAAEAELGRIEAEADRVEAEAAYLAALAVTEDGLASLRAFLA